MESHITNNPKSFWLFFNAKKTSNGIPKSMIHGQLSANEEQDVANLFAMYFSSIYEDSTTPDDSSRFLDGIHDIVDIGAIHLEVSEVFEAINGLDVTKGPGYDLIPPTFIRNCAYSLSHVLTTIFNQSLAEGTFLAEWKTAYISPIFKSGRKDMVENYRPIVKLSVIPKLLDKIINHRLFAILKNTICSQQHGFFHGRSTATNLCLFTHFCINSIENGIQVDVLYTDFKKAFDKVNHSILTKKLFKMGFHSSILNWLNSYISERVLFVKVRKSESDPIYVKSGIPQGSHLGPLLFLLFVNDIPSIFSDCQCLLYADDLKIFHKITSIEDCVNFQKDIAALIIWCNNNHLSLNFSKCNIMTYTRKFLPIIYGYTHENGQMFSRVNLLKDLGVYFDNALTFKDHLNYIVSKANSQFGFLKRNTKMFSSHKSLTVLFGSLVRSHLEYVSFVWNPFYEYGINRIEKIQKRFTRFALRKNFSFDNMPPYDNRCNLLGILELSNRRKLQGIIFIKDIMDSNIDSPELLSILPFRIPTRSLRETHLFAIPFHRTNYGMNEPMTRCLQTFNWIANSVDITLDTYSFKRSVLRLLYSDTSV